MRITLDAGHGMNTPGKRTPDGMREWEFNNRVAMYAMAELDKYDGIELQRVDDPSGKEDVSLQDRTDKANKWGADVYISIHANAYGFGDWNNVSGIETFVHSSNPKEAYQLAKLVQENLIKDTKRSDRSVKTANFHALRETNMTAILVECGFMTNKEEAALLKSDDYRKTCGMGIVKGIVAMYGLKKIETQLFKDVTDDHWALDAIQYCKEKGFINGYPDGTFKPNDTVTRAQFAQVIYNMRK